MANPNNTLQEWNVKVRFELNHEKGICLTEILGPDNNVIKSMRYVQGFHFDKDRHLMDRDDVEAFKWLLRTLGEPEIPETKS